MSSNQPHTEVSQLNSQPDPKTLEMVLDLAKTAPGQQVSQANSLDTKMVQIFQAASVVIGLAGLSSGNLAQWWVVDVLLIGALIFYSITAGVVFHHLRPKPFWDLRPHTLWRKCWNLKSADAQHSAVDAMTESYALNLQTLEDKARYVRIAIITIGAEVLLVGAALILSRLYS